MSTYLAYMEIFSLESGGPSKKSFPFSSSDVRIVNSMGFLPITEIGGGESSHCFSWIFFEKKSENINACECLELEEF